MSLTYIRKAYGVPAKRGGRIRYTDHDGRILNCTIVSAYGPHLRVLVDAPRYRLTLHPTWGIEYLPAETTPPTPKEQ